LAEDFSLGREAVYTGFASSRAATSFGFVEPPRRGVDGPSGVLIFSTLQGNG